MMKQRKQSESADRDPGTNLIDRMAVWLLGPALLPFLLVARQRERRQAETRRAAQPESPCAKWVPRGLRCPLGLACERQAECRLWHPEPGFSGRYLPPQAERSER